ncbi:hypothetical protein KCU90_g2455, partial [Aureobasidium melanogenum]
MMPADLLRDRPIAGRGIPERQTGKRALRSRLPQGHDHGIRIARHIVRIDQLHTGKSACECKRRNLARDDRDPRGQRFEKRHAMPLGTRRHDEHVRLRQHARHVDRHTLGALIDREILRENFGAGQTRRENQIAAEARGHGPGDARHAPPMNRRRHADQQHDHLNQRRMHRRLRVAHRAQIRNQHGDQRADRHIDHQNSEQRHRRQPGRAEDQREERFSDQPQHLDEDRQPDRDQEQIDLDEPGGRLRTAAMMCRKSWEKVLRHGDRGVGEQHLRKPRRHLVAAELCRAEQFANHHFIELVQQQIDHTAGPDPAAEAHVMTDAGPYRANRRARFHGRPGQDAFQAFARHQSDQHRNRPGAEIGQCQSDRTIYKRRRNLDAGNMLETPLALHHVVRGRCQAAQQRQQRGQLDQHQRTVQMKLTAQQGRERHQQQ